LITLHAGMPAPPLVEHLPDQPSLTARASSSRVGEKPAGQRVQQRQVARGRLQERAVDPPPPPCSQRGPPERGHRSTSGTYSDGDGHVEGTPTSATATCRRALGVVLARRPAQVVVERTVLDHPPPFGLPVDPDVLRSRTRGCAGPTGLSRSAVGEVGVLAEPPVRAGWPDHRAAPGLRRRSTHGWPVHRPDGPSSIMNATRSRG